MPAARLISIHHPEGSRLMSCCRTLHGQFVLLIATIALPTVAVTQTHTLSVKPADLVLHTNGLDDVHTAGSGYSARIADPSDPYIVLGPIEIDARRERLLQLDIELSSRAGLQVFFADDTGAFIEARSFRPVRRLAIGRVVYEIDLRNVDNWIGTIRSLRLDFDQLKTGDRVTLFGVATAEQPAENPKVVRLAPRSRPAPGERVRTERLAAFHKSVVITDESVPHSAVFTYLTKRFTYTDSNRLAKIMPVIQKDGDDVTCDLAEQVQVEDTPGGVAAEFILADMRIRTSITPLFVGRGAKALEGVALYTIRTEPIAQTVTSADDRLSLVINSDQSGLRDCDSTAIAGGVTIVDGVARYWGGEERIPVALRASGNIVVAEDGAIHATFPQGSGHLLIAFAESPERATELTRLDSDAAARQVADYYWQMWAANHIETPEPVLDDAFKHALRTLEYTWIEPIGWLECIHHWFSLWHMQATAGAEWVGQQDRSRACTLAHAAQLTAEGAVPQFSPSGHIHRDFGGSNQYWAWQVRHYWQFTADRAFAEQAGPALDKVLAQTSREYDKDDNALLAWGLQIGNQEDYVATPYDGTTPSVEGINMLITRAELTRGLGDETTAERFERRAARLRALLGERLWMSDLGRFAFFVDPHGSRRLDGQYHTFTYPVIWGIADAMNSYTMLRHMHDRLTGPNGGVYCSNNFPNHVGGTWGMQTGAAQQPWAAWALSAAGQFERTYQPLKAVAGWVMNADHRGSWPEVAIEPTPAYFSPPAGLFVASTVEALFGLKVDAPNHVLHVSPSFPSHWPKATLRLAEYGATYTRHADRIEYTVESKQPLERHVTWHLPPCRISRVLIDGHEAAFAIEPGVNTIKLAFRTPATTSTTFSIDCEPVTFSVSLPVNAAQGEQIRVEVSGASIVAVDDRCGVLSRHELIGPGTLQARLRDDLLDSSAGFGRLGQLTFSRRTFFVMCSTADDIRFWRPIDLTVLPRYEASPAAVHVNSDGTTLSCNVLIRNNTNQPLGGTGLLSLAGGEYGLTLSVPARSEQGIAATMPASMAGLLALGDNRATITLPDRAGTIGTVLSVVEPFTKLEPLTRAIKTSLVHIPLDESAMIADTQWPKLRVNPAYPHMPWAGSRPPLEAVAGRKTLSLPDLPFIDFVLPDRKFIPISFKAGRPSHTLDLKSRLCRKLFVLVVPFLDNHDMFVPVGRISVRSPEDIVHVRTLRFPGDLDWWSPPAVVGDFATIGREPRDRFGLLPLLSPEQADWAEGRPPVFPQPRFWSESRHILTGSSVMNVIEVDLGRFVEVASLTLESIGADPAFGLVAVTVQTADGQSVLEGTPWNAPAAYRQPRTLFNFEQRGAEGWMLEGEAFSVASVPSLFSGATLNSLAKAGEMATGRATSPDFRLTASDTTLRIRYHGGQSKADRGPGLMAIDLIDASDGRRLHRLSLAADHNLRWERVDVRSWAGRAVRLQLIDENTDPSFAWLGLSSVTVTAE